ncbi:MAG: hypothetical protein LC745_06970 [Planctomycetia bacterium]|nr:hypothetical protein [Planctomycetia bacterium]
MTKVSSPALLVTFSLESAIHSYLRGLAFAPCYLPETVAFVASHGTATGCEWLEPDEADAVNALVASYTGDLESNPETWPAWTDAHVWSPTPDADAPVALEAFEPDDADREWLATQSVAQSAYEAGLILPPIRGAAPRPGEPVSPQFERAVEVSRRVDALLSGRSRPQPDVTDADVALVGAVG